jgi:tetratricopeptide (TPR) repeat protein
MRELGVIEERLRDDAVAALKAGDKQRRAALSTIVSALKKARIDSGRAPSEADELAVLKRERKRRAEALDAWQAAVEHDPEQYETWFNLGVKAPELGRFDLARRALRHFIETAPPDRYADDIAASRQLLARLGS